MKLQIVPEGLCYKGFYTKLCYSCKLCLRPNAQLSWVNPQDHDTAILELNLAYQLIRTTIPLSCSLHYQWQEIVWVMVQDEGKKLWQMQSKNYQHGNFRDLIVFPQNFLYVWDLSNSVFNVRKTLLG